MGVKDYFTKQNSNNNSRYAIIITVIIHVVIILLALNLSEIKQVLISQSSLQMVELQDERPEIQSMLKPPKIIIPPPAIHLTIPSVNFIELPFDALVITAPYELPDRSAKQRQNIFDPKLRKKLIEAEPFNRVLQNVSLKSWRTSDGQVVDEIGDGMCMKTLPKMDSRERGTGYTTFKCGPSDSEKAMERVMADYESHKVKP